MKKWIIVFSVCISLNSVIDSHPDRSLSIRNQSDVFAILNTKCNACHQVKNPRKIFTKGNMNEFSRQIYRQVFVWKRMPKGDEIKLTIAEKETLKNWINNLKK